MFDHKQVGTAHVVEVTNPVSIFKQVECALVTSQQREQDTRE
jgi:hypothetical protein